LVIDNGRAINTFTPDVATNSDVYKQGSHYGVPGVLVDGQRVEDVVRAGRAVTDYVRRNGPAIMQVCAYSVSYTCVYNSRIIYYCNVYTCCFNFVFAHVERVQV
jgi:Dehydrogenase E1 component